MRQEKLFICYTLFLCFPVAMKSQEYETQNTVTNLQQLHSILNIDNPSLKDGIVGLWNDIAGEPRRTTAAEIKQLVDKTAQEQAHNLATSMAELEHQLNLARTRVLTARYEDHYDREKLYSELANLVAILTQFNSASGEVEKLVQELARAAHALEQRTLSEQELQQYSLAVVDLKEALAHVIEQYQQERERIDEQVSHLLDNYGRNGNAVKDYWKQIENDSAQSLKRLKNAVHVNMSQLEVLMVHIKRLSDYLGHPMPDIEKCLKWHR